MANVVRVDLTGLGSHVRAVDAEVRDHLAQHLVQLVPRVVAMTTMALADLEEERGEPVHVAAEDIAHHEVLLLPGDAGEVRRLTGEPRVGAGERLFALGVDEQATDAIQEVVAGGPRHHPRLAQPLTGLEDLLGDDPGRGAGVVQATEVVLRIAQPVRMVDTKPVEHAVAEPAQDERMGRREHPIVLRAEPHERVDVEEAPIAQLAAGRPPERQTVVLALEERVQRVGARIHLVDDLVDDGRDFGVLPEQAFQEPAQHLLVAVAALDAQPIRRRGERQAAERIGDEGQRIGARARRGHAEQLVE